MMLIRFFFICTTLSFLLSHSDNNEADEMRNHNPRIVNCPTRAPKIRVEQPPGSFVYQVRAVDRDVVERGGKIAYGFVPAVNSHLKIDPDNGTITTIRTFSRNDPDREKEVKVIVHAVDNGKPHQLDNFCQFSVIIVDINDNESQFDKTVYEESNKNSVQNRSINDVVNETMKQIPREAVEKLGLICFEAGCSNTKADHPAETKFNFSFIITISICLLLLLLVLVFVVVRRKKAEIVSSDRENVVSHEEEGGRDNTTYDMEMSEIYDDGVQNVNCDEAGIEVNKTPNINRLLHERKELIDKCDFWPMDDVRPFAYEGDGNSSGSLSPLISDTNEEDCYFDYLSNRGPKFRKLSEIYRSHRSNENTDSN